MPTSACTRGSARSGVPCPRADRSEPLCLIPLDRALEPFAEVDSGPEAELALGPAGVELAARLAVRLARVPPDGAAEPGRLGDELDQLADADFEGGAEVDRIGPVVALGGQDDAFGRVLDVQELPRRCAIAPHHDLGGAGVARLDALLDQRRDHV